MNATQVMTRSDTRGLIVTALQFVCLILLVVIVAVVNAMAAPPKQKRTMPRKSAAARREPNNSKAKKDPQAPEPSVILESTPEDQQVENADIAITARVRAKSLRFEAVPNTKVVFSGQPDRATVWEADRENLPTPVQPGVTYRDIGIRLKITSVFRDIDKIVAEALGEVPVKTETTSDAQPSPANPRTSKSAAAASPSTTRETVREKP